MSDRALTRMGAVALADAMRAGDVSAREVADAHLDVIAAHDGIAADGDDVPEPVL